MLCGLKNDQMMSDPRLCLQAQIISHRDSRMITAGDAEINFAAPAVAFRAVNAHLIKLHAESEKSLLALLCFAAYSVNYSYIYTGW